LTPLEFLYYLGYLLKKRHSFRLQRRLPYAVISIGNITVGGTGKTPATMAVAEESVKRGFSPVILTRGYRGSVKGPCVVSPDKTLDGSFTGNPRAVISTVKDAGDEPLLMAERLKDVPVIKSASRYKGGIFALQSFLSNPEAPFIFILDDGFQHWSLYRDINIVLVDGFNPFGNRKMLPLGILREPLGELKRADIFVITRCRDEQLADELRDAWPGKPVYFSQYSAVRARNKAAAELPLEELRNRRTFAFCGIAHPESFRHTLDSLSLSPVGFKVYRDHHFYTPADIHNLERQSRELQSDVLLTTEKDMIKLKELKIPDTVFSLEMEWNTDAAFYDEVFKKVSSKQ